MKLGALTMTCGAQSMGANYRSMDAKASFDIPRGNDLTHAANTDQECIQSEKVSKFGVGARTMETRRPLAPPSMGCGVAFCMLCPMQTGCGVLILVIILKT